MGPSIRGPDSSELVRKRRETREKIVLMLSGRCKDSNTCAPRVIGTQADTVASCFNLLEVSGPQVAMVI